MWYNYTMEYYLTVKRNELQHGWTSKILCQEKEPQYKRLHSMLFHLCAVTRKDKPRQESRSAWEIFVVTEILINWIAMVTQLYRFSKYKLNKLWYINDTLVKLLETDRETERGSCQMQMTWTMAFREGKWTCSSDFTCNLWRWLSYGRDQSHWRKTSLFRFLKRKG